MPSVAMPCDAQRSVAVPSYAMLSGAMLCDAKRSEDLPSGQEVK